MEPRHFRYVTPMALCNITLGTNTLNLRKRGRSCCWPFKTIRGIPSRSVSSPRAMLIWDGSTKRARSSPGCAPLPLWSCPAICLGATPSTGSFFCRACAWRSARRHEPDYRRAAIRVYRCCYAPLAPEKNPSSSRQFPGAPALAAFPCVSQDGLEYGTEWGLCKLAGLAIGAADEAAQ